MNARKTTHGNQTKHPYDMTAYIRVCQPVFRAAHFQLELNGQPFRQKAE